MTNSHNHHEHEPWTGKRGFDEAEYYEEDKYELSNDQSDDEIQLKVEEAI